MRQKTNLGHCERAQGVRTEKVVMPLLAAALTVLIVAVPAARGQSSGVPAPPTLEALLARGVVHSAGSDMREGLSELRSAVGLEPGHVLARRALAVALLRAGQFALAEAEFTSSLGEGLVRGLASGAVSSTDLPDDIDGDALLGLATSIQLQGRAREADRLYRAYADVVGPMSKNAGRAYFRLHELATDSGVEWLDADAELAKALAVDPNIRSATLLPEFPDPRALPELAPYVRPIELSPSRADTAVRYDSLPLLSVWVAPADTLEALVAMGEGRLRLEILVSAEGFPVEVVPVSEVAEEEIIPLTDAVGELRFTPAVVDGEEASAWILVGEEAETESAEEEQEEERQEERLKEGL